MGTPKYADDDAYVFVTHNSAEMTVGHFSVLDTAAGADVIYNFTETAGPFGPFGFVANPIPGGNYGAGVGNTNDIAVWGLYPSPGASTGESGSVWVFQMPSNTAVGGPNVTQTIALTGWRYTAAPLLASKGQYLYWLVSRSGVRAWYGAAFSASPEGEYSFDRGTPSFKAAPYTPVVDNIETPTVMCGGPANPEFACFSATNILTGTGPPLWTVATGGTGVYADPLMSTGGDRVYWVDNAGLVSAADPSDGTGGWNASTSVSIEANTELSSDGARFFFADTTGNIVAWEVAEGTLPNVTLPEPGQTPAPAPTTDTGSSMAPSGVGETSFPTNIGGGGGGGMPSSPSSPSSPTSGGGNETSGASSMAVFSVVAASLVAAVFF